MKTFNYLFLKDFSIPCRMVKSLSAVENNKGASLFLLNDYPKILNALEKNSSYSAAFNSLEITGKPIVENHNIINNPDKDCSDSEKEVLNYYKALAFIKVNYESLQINEKSLFTIYNQLFNDIKPAYQQAEKKEFGLDSRGCFVFDDADEEKESIKDQMDSLFVAYNEALSNNDIYPLFLIPCFVSDFLKIRPFADGNERMASLLVNLLLLKSGYDVNRYTSYERIIKDNKEDYFLSIKRTYSVNEEQNPELYVSFIENFLFNLSVCYQEIGKRYEILKGEKLSKLDRVGKTIYLEDDYITKDQIHELWPDMSLNTIELALSDLLKMGRIEKEGVTNGVSYRWHRNHK